MSRAKCPGCSRDPISHTAEELKEWHPKRWEFQQAAKGIGFTKDFNPSLDAIIHDSLETASARILAWIKRMAWGNHCLYCIGEDGNPMFAVDITAHLGIKKQRVSKVLQYLEARGYIARRGTAKLLYPCISPQLGGPPTDQSEKSPEWATFVQLWKVAHSTDFEALEVARSTVERIRKVMRADYKRSRASGTEPTALEEESLESSESVSAAAAASTEHPPAAAAAPTHPTGPRSREWLERQGAHDAIAEEVLIMSEPPAEPITPILEAVDIIDSRARRLLKDCGGATVDEVAARCREVAASVKGNKNVVGIVLNQVPEFFHSPAKLAQWRRERESAADEAAAIAQRAEERRQQEEKRAEELRAIFGEEAKGAS